MFTISNIFAETFAALICISLLLFFLYKLKFFKQFGLSFNNLALIFGLKIVFSILLALIYSKYYTDRSTADIFKYFDDSRYIFEAYAVNPSHFFQLIFGIDSNAEYLNVYTNHTLNWLNHSNEYLSITHSTDFNFLESNRLMIKLNALMRMFTFGYFFVHSILILFVGMIGQLMIYKTFSRYLKNKHTELIIILFLMPSVLLWSSGILKECIIFFALGLFVVNFAKILNRNHSFKTIFYLILSIILILISKYYLLAALLPASVSALIVNSYKKLKPWIVYLLVNVLLFLIIVMVGTIMPKFNAFGAIAAKQNNLLRSSKGGVYVVKETKQKQDTLFFDNNFKLITDNTNYINIPANTKYQYFSNGEPTGEEGSTKNDSSRYYLLFSYTKAGSYIDSPKLQPNAISVIKAMPMAMINAMVRPFITESKSIMILLAALENLFILLVIVCCLVFRERNIKQWNVIMFCINFALITYLLIGLTTPVLGTIVRLRVFATIFLLLPMLMMVDKNRIKKLLKI